MSDHDETEQPLNLASLKTNLEPPSDLEDRVVSALRNRNLMGTGLRQNTMLRRLMVAAACLVFFIAGSLYQKSRMAQSVSMSDSTYVLFLMQGPSFQGATNQQQRAARVEEYRNWAIGLRNRGLRVSGTKLRNEKKMLGAASFVGRSTQDEISGYFLIDVENPEQALRISEEHPHLKHGGTIQLRRVEPVQKTEKKGVFGPPAGGNRS